MQVSQIAEEACQKIEQVTAEKNALFKERVETIAAMEELKKLHSDLQKEVSNFLSPIKNIYNIMGKKMNRIWQSIKNIFFIDDLKIFVYLFVEECHYKNVQGFLCVLL